MGEVRCRQSLPYPGVEGLLPEIPPARDKASQQTTRESNKKRAHISPADKQRNKEQTRQKAHTDKEASKQKSTTSTYGQRTTRHIGKDRARQKE
ncbi:hypothetical protein Tco_0845540 [Tanacetum coccineum]